LERLEFGIQEASVKSRGGSKALLEVMLVSGFCHEHSRGVLEMVIAVRSGGPAGESCRQRYASGNSAERLKGHKECQPWREKSVGVKMRWERELPLWQTSGCRGADCALQESGLPVSSSI